MLGEYSPTSVLVIIHPPMEYETCIANFNVSVNGSQCSNLTHDKNKHNLTYSGLALYTNIYQFSITAESKWIKSSNTSTESFKANGQSKL